MKCKAEDPSGYLPAPRLLVRLSGFCHMLRERNVFPVGGSVIVPPDVMRVPSWTDHSMDDGQCRMEGEPFENELGRKSSVVTPTDVRKDT